MSQFSEWLRDVRKSKGMTQREFADAVGVCYVSICNYENDNAIPSIRNSNKIANYTNTPFLEIYQMLKK